MAEKRGLEQQNLINDFNTAGCLEVWSSKSEQWFRVNGLTLDIFGDFLHNLWSDCTK